MNELNQEELDLLREGKIFVAGHRGLVGSALVRRLRAAGCENLLLKTRTEVDLANQQQVRELMLDEKADYVFLAAALVGGIYANNTYPAQFIYRLLVYAVYCVWAVPVYIQNLHHSPCRKIACLQVRWRKPTNLMRSLKLPASRCVSLTIVNMARIFAV